MFIAQSIQKYYVHMFTMGKLSETASSCKAKQSVGLQILATVFYVFAIVNMARVKGDLKVVSTSDVKYIGTIDETVEFDRETYSVNKFLGIPYAEPPLGDLRLKKPLPVPVESESFFPNKSFRADRMRDLCLQTKVSRRQLKAISTSEDCLYLNVYTPVSANRSNQKAVIVWIHGGVTAGKFENGGANYVSGSVLSVIGDVIVVTFNYRLSLLGFCSISRTDVKGNYGLWDQQLALEWVNKNIEYFGGDPDRVTLLGQDHGGISVVLQSLFPKNKDLFQRGIAIDGSSFHGLDRGESPFVLSNPFQPAFFSSLSCYGDDSESVVDCLKLVKSSEMTRVTKQPFLPVLDDEFIVRSTVPYDLNASNVFLESFSRKDFMFGFSSTHRMANDMKTPATHSILQKQLTTVIKTAIRFSFENPSIDVNAISKAVVNRYTDLLSAEDSVSILKHLDLFKDDFYRTMPVIKSSFIHAGGQVNTSNTYLFRFDVGDTKRHVDPARYIFGFAQKSNDGNDKPSRVDFQNSRDTIRMVTNFAKFGNPYGDFEDDIPEETTQSLAHAPETPEYIRIPSLGPKHSPDELKHNPRIEFWLDILPNVVEKCQHLVEYELITRNRTVKVDISRERADGVMIALGAVIAFLGFILLALGIFVYYLKVKHRKLMRKLREENN